jgi:hypothetical protein
MRPWRAHQVGVCKSPMKKEDARRAILSEYDGWAKKHPDDASMMGGFLFFRYLQNERSDLLDFRGWQQVAHCSRLDSGSGERLARPWLRCAMQSPNAGSDGPHTPMIFFLLFGSARFKVASSISTDKPASSACSAKVSGAVRIPPRMAHHYCSLCALVPVDEALVGFSFSSVHLHGRSASNFVNAVVRFRPKT